MAYVTGTANSLTDLLAAIQGACTANGWTLSGNVLHKGTCFCEIAIATVPPSGPGQCLRIRGCDGIDGSNNPTGLSNQNSGWMGAVGGITDRNTGQVLYTFTFPVTYFVHINTSPDEVYVVVNYAVSAYQTMAFGQSAMPGLVGSGNWYSASIGHQRTYWYAPFDPAGVNSSLMGTALLFYFSNPSYPYNCGVHHSLDSDTWSVEGGWRDSGSLLVRQPNQWNSESILIPIRVYAARPSGFVSPVLEAAHARYINLSTLQDQQVVSLGPDKWKVYPAYARQFGVGHAFRYDGP